MDMGTGSLAGTDEAARLRLAAWAALAVPGALLLGALGSETIGGLHPCEMCLWQRWPHLAAVALAGLALAMPRARRPLVLAAALGMAASGAIGVFHAGVEQGWWQGLTGCAAGPSGASGAALLEQLRGAPVIRCDQIAWSFLGLSLAAWNAVISLVSAGGLAWLTLRR